MTTTQIGEVYEIQTQKVTAVETTLRKQTTKNTTKRSVPKGWSIEKGIFTTCSQSVSGCAHTALAGS